MGSVENEGMLDLSCMVKSGRILATALEHAINISKEGANLKSIDNEINRIIKENNALPSFLGYCGYPASSCLSLNDQVVHAIPNDRRLQNGDILTIDIGVSFMGHHTDAARTIIIGSDEAILAEEMIVVSILALEAGISKAISGNRLGDISHAIQAVIEKYGYKTPLELGGHGIGTKPHYDPFIPNYGPSGSGPILERGACLALEPIVMNGSNKLSLDEDNWTVFSPYNIISVHIEDTIVVWDGIAVILTRETLDGNKI